MTADFKDKADLVKRSNCILAAQIGCEPYVIQFVRKAFFESTSISVTPTKNKKSYPLSCQGPLRIPTFWLARFAGCH